jgi:replication factor A1
MKTKLIYLIMRGSEVIAQFSMDSEFLANKSNQLEKFMGTDRIRRYLSRKNKVAPAYSIRDVRAGMRNVNLKAKILEVAEPKLVVTRYGNTAIVAKVLIGDETGTIKLCLWNGQIDGVSVGDAVQIKNAQAAMFRGEPFLSLGKKGALDNKVLEPRLNSAELLNTAT